MVLHTFFRLLLACKQMNSYEVEDAIRGTSRCEWMEPIGNCGVVEVPPSNEGLKLYQCKLDNPTELYNANHCKILQCLYNFFCKIKCYMFSLGVLEN